MSLALALAWGVSAFAQVVAGAAAETTLDVLVSDGRGRVVDGMTEADFLVTEHGVPLKVERVRLVRPIERTDPSRRRPTTAVPLSTVGSDETLPITSESRLFGILLDEYHVTAGSAAELVRQQLIRFVTEDLGPDDWVAIVKPLDSLVGIRLTADRGDMVKAIEGFDPRRGDYTPRTAFEKEFIAGGSSRIDAARAQIVASALNALALRLGRFVPWRKTLLFVSEGFAAGGVRRGDESLPVLSTAVVTANRAHVAIYALDPSVASEPATSEDMAGPGAGAKDALRALALETSGRAARSVADVGATLKSALAEASAYYAVTVSSDGRPSDGQWHSVDVSVRRDGPVVRARHGYWVPPDAERHDVAVDETTARQALSRLPRRSSALIRPWFGLSPGEGGNVRVSFSWEPAPRVPGDRAWGPPPARVNLSVMALDGTPVFDGVVLPAGQPTDRVGRSRASFEVPRGRLLVHLAIEDSASRIVDRDVRDLVVSGFHGPVSFGTPELLRARTVREQREIEADPQATPVATRQFSRAERLMVRVPVVTLGEVPVVSARLVSGLGGVMWGLSATPVAGRPTTYQIDVTLASLAPGAYSIEIAAKTAAGEARESLPVRVTP